MWQKGGIDMYKDFTPSIESMSSLLEQIVIRQNNWIKVHAAEYLLWSGFSQQEIWNTFIGEEQKYSAQYPYCVGIWRVLVMAAFDKQHKQYWQERIIQTFLDRGSPARVHAAESLAKLGVSISSISPDISMSVQSGDDRILDLCTRWSNAFYDTISLEPAQEYFLHLALAENERQDVRILSAYILRTLSPLSQDKWLRFCETATITTDPATMASLYSCAVLLVPAAYENHELFEDCFAKLKWYLFFQSRSVRTDVCHALAEKGKPEDIGILMKLVDNQKSLGNTDDNTDVQAAAAYAIIRILKRYNEIQYTF